MNINRIHKNVSPQPLQFRIHLQEKHVKYPLQQTPQLFPSQHEQQYQYS